METRAKTTTLILLLVFPFFATCQVATTPKDVIKVMTYNVLRYGDGCQGSDEQMHRYLKTIVDYSDPDILGLIKVASISSVQGGRGKANAGFADSILAHALNVAVPGKYAGCPHTNVSGDNNQALLYYNKHKFGCSSVITLSSKITDINMYKLYYLGYNFPKNKDTIFLYVVLLHASSGDDADERDQQMREVMTVLRRQFPSLPDIIIMGDFNLRKSNEKGYQVLTNNAEETYKFIDPPFGIDKTITYPANWDKHPERFAAYLTTSTRKKEKEPNSCGTGGGAKGWYDHILLGPSFTRPSGHFYYIPHSYRTIGNDGQRINASVNELSNNSAPARVLNALYHMSNKYPVMLKLGISL